MIPSSNSNNIHTSSEYIASYCTHASKAQIKAKFVVPGNKKYPHGIIRYRLLSDYDIQDLLFSIGEYWTMNHPDVVYVSFLSNR